MKIFIKIQLFGDPAGDPNAKGPNAAANGPQTPGADGDDAQPNAAQELIDFRKNFVTREKYEEAVKRGDDFLRAIVENREDEVIPEDPSKKIDPNKIAKDLFKEDNTMSDIEYVQNILDLREARMKAGERDPFLPDNFREEDVVIAQNVADVFKDCIKVADGDNGAFIALLQSRMKDAQRSPKNILRR